MREVFYEESAKIQDEKSATRKYNIFKTFSILSYTMFAFWIIIILLYDFSTSYCYLLSVVCYLSYSPPVLGGVYEVGGGYSINYQLSNFNSQISTLL